MNTTPSVDFSTYSFGEGKTGLGHPVSFTCRPGMEEEVRKFLAEHVRTIDLHTISRVNVGHGSYGQYTRYDIVQHKYAGGGPGENGGWGYIEVLEIKNPPDGRWGIVVNECNSSEGSTFTEWETLDDACKAYEKNWSSTNTAERFPKFPGFKRMVVCGALTPWFYAIGDQLLIGDYAFPDGLQDDPVFVFGRKFVVVDENGMPIIKTCMGTRFVQDGVFDYEHSHREKKVDRYRLVYWDDGSVWDESHQQSWWSSDSKNTLPRPLKDEEVWIVEAVNKFRVLLAGKVTKFSLDFLDGSKFFGNLVQKPRRKSPCASGDYFLGVDVKGEKKLRQGWVNNFEPTPETPDIVSFVVNELTTKQGLGITSIEVKKGKVKPGGKKWAGVFFGKSK